jgi:hypothetical protein
MYGFYKQDKYAIGWLNPYFSRTPDGNTDKGHYWIMSDTTIHEMVKDLDISFEAFDGLDESGTA